jgi:hypothetical protein
MDVAEYVTSKTEMSGWQPLNRPTSGLQLIADPIVQAIRSFFPKLNDFGTYSVATPSIRTGRTCVVREGFGQFRSPLFEHGTPINDRALVADHGADPRPERPWLPVGVWLIVIDLLNRSTYSDLTV